MKTTIHYLALAACLLSGGCSTTRSISNSGYSREAPSVGYAPRRSSDPGFVYKGELSEFDVLGVNRGRDASEAEIHQALSSAKRVRLQPGSSILLIQSGAMFPDGPIVSELSRYCKVNPFSGVPPDRAAGDDATGYSRSLRLAAARAGCEIIVCYWGILESAETDSIGKPVAWVPVVNLLLPDEKQHMRIRLKVALIDVATGSWSVHAPEPFEDTARSTSFTRKSKDQQQVELLKRMAYVKCVSELVGNH